MTELSESILVDEPNDIDLPLGEHCIIRKLMPTDELALRDMFAHCCADDIYLRCFAAVKDFPDAMAKRFAGINPDEEIALVATPTGDDGDGVILGIAHVILDQSRPLTAEFDIMVRTDQKGHGIGYALMTCLLRDAKKRGWRAVEGFILQENRAMLQMAQELGFQVVAHTGGVAEVLVTL